MPRPSQLYPASSRTEIDLRAELAGLFHGSAQELPKARKIILRRMRRDDNGNPIVAPSVSSLTGEPDLDTFDPFARGEMYLWDEEYHYTRLVVGKSTQAGLANKDKRLAGGIINPWTVVFFFEYDVEPTWYDRVVELQLDTEGDPIVPLRRGRIFKPESVIDYRSDNGRIAFWGVFCSEKDALSFEEEFHKR
jgi:hypothetical protein